MELAELYNGRIENFAGSRNNLLVQGLLLRLFCKFAVN